MIEFIWPIFIIVASNTIYNICTKSTSEDINSFAALTVTYVVSAVVSAVMFVITNNHKNIFTEAAKINWSSIVLGLAIVGVEFGYIAAYRLGWKVGTCSLAANICLAVVLLMVGICLYQETISMHQLLGMVVCVIGLILISK